MAASRPVCAPGLEESIRCPSRFYGCRANAGLSIGFEAVRYRLRNFDVELHVELHMHSRSAPGVKYLRQAPILVFEFDVQPLKKRRNFESQRRGPPGGGAQEKIILDQA